MTNSLIDPAAFNPVWALRGAVSSAASRGLVLHSGDSTLTVEGAREVARRLLQAADDAERQRSA